MPSIISYLLLFMKNLFYKAGSCLQVLKMSAKYIDKVAKRIVWTSQECCVKSYMPGIHPRWLKGHAAVRSSHCDTGISCKMDYHCTTVNVIQDFIMEYHCTTIHVIQGLFTYFLSSTHVLLYASCAEHVLQPFLSWEFHCKVLTLLSAVLGRTFGRGVQVNDILPLCLRPGFFPHRGVWCRFRIPLYTSNLQKHGINIIRCMSVSVWSSNKKRLARISLMREIFFDSASCDVNLI